MSSTFRGKIRFLAEMEIDTTVMPEATVSRWLAQLSTKTGTVFTFICFSFLFVFLRALDVAVASVVLHFICWNDHERGTNLLI